MYQVLQEQNSGFHEIGRVMYLHIARLVAETISREQKCTTKVTVINNDKVFYWFENGLELSAR